MENTINTLISAILLDIGINPRLAGFDYLKTAIKLVYDDRTYLRNATKKLYPEIASIHGKTKSSVERAIRHAIERLFDCGNNDSINKYFSKLIESKSGKVTNLTLIATVVEKISTMDNGGIEQ